MHFQVTDVTDNAGNAGVYASVPSLDSNQIPSESELDILALYQYSSQDRVS
jgi:hypothetical protein